MARAGAAPAGAHSDRPLLGRRIAVTRPAEGLDELAQRLEEAGAVALVLPLLRIEPPADVAPLHTALRRLSDYDWILFTSANAVRAVAAASRDPLPAGTRVAAVGPATTRAVHESLGGRVDAVPEQYTGTALVPALRAAGATLDGRTVLWPRAEGARMEVCRALQAAGAVVADPVAYRTLRSPEAAARLRALVARGEVDVVTFTSPSAVECYAEAGGAGGAVVVAVIGPVTAMAAGQHGVRVHVAPVEHTIPALVASLAEYFRSAP